MIEDKMMVINKLFNSTSIRTVWDKNEEKYYISIVDVVGVLSESNNPRDYWYKIKKRARVEEEIQLSTICRQLKLKASDGKYRLTDVCDIKGMFRIIQSIPSKNAEPIKQWLASLGSERIDETFDPSLSLQRSIDLYRTKGYSEEWISKRIKSLQDRKGLTDIWKDGGIKEGIEYAILTNEIYKTWSGMTAREYKEHKGLRKENLRDNMSSIELILTDLSEETTKLLAEEYNPQGLEANKNIARTDGSLALNTRKDLENKLGKSIVSKTNKLNYEYKEDSLLENKK